MTKEALKLLRKVITQELVTIWPLLLQMFQEVVNKQLMHKKLNPRQPQDMMNNTAILLSQLPKIQ